MDEEIKWFMASRGCIGVRLPHDLSWWVLRPPFDRPVFSERHLIGVRVYPLLFGWRITRRDFDAPDDERETGGAEG